MIRVVRERRAVRRASDPAARAPAHMYRESVARGAGEMLTVVGLLPSRSVCVDIP